MCLQVRETETWMTPRAGDSHDDLDSSGDFIFHNEDSTAFDDEDKDNYEDTEDYEDMSGSGDKSLLDEDSVASSEVSDHPEYNFFRLIRLKS